MDKTPHPRLHRFILYLTVGVTGAVIMMLEILGTRIIGPYFGVSLYVWSSLITVTLISLALGYFLGGFIADRQKTFRLYRIVGLAGIFTCLIPVLKTPVLHLTHSMDIRWGSFLCATVLFSAPLTLLAMMGPFVIKLFAFQIEKVGRASGSVFAFSTIGSVMGTLLLGFFFLPTLGVRLIIYGISGLLFAQTVLLFWFERSSSKNRPWLHTLLFLILAGGGFLLAGSGHSNEIGARFTLIDESESLYGKVRVVEDKKQGERWLLSDFSAISAIDLNTGNSLFAYLDIMELLPYFYPKARRALLIGLGAGYIPKVYDSLGVETDVIEIDPEVARMAQKHFSFKAPGRIIIGDARYEVSILQEQYDIVIHDCFSRGEVPAHLMSKEMLLDLKKRLKTHGVLALNFVSLAKGTCTEAMSAVNRTIQSVFPYHRVIIPDSKDKLIDMVHFASMKPIVLEKRGIKGPLSLSAGYALRRLKRLETPAHENQGYIITDDFNPLQVLQVGMADVYRDLLKERFGSEILSW